MKEKLFIILFLSNIFSLVFAQTAKVTVSGQVRDENGVGIKNVVVNDGVNFTVTDEKGIWTLPTDTIYSKFVSVSTPADYILPQVKVLAKAFYIRINDVIAGKGVFTLTKRKKKSDSFCYLAISDPQVRNDIEMKRWKSETVVDLYNMTTSLAKTNEVVVMTLGDLVFDNMNLYDEYAHSLESTKMTVFQCIGNHDFNKKFQDLHNYELGASEYGESNYNRYFGPVNYSFNIGNVHVVTIKNINYVGGKKYLESITGADIAWLCRDLSYVPKGTLVFLNMHAAAWNTIEEDGNVRNANKLAEILKDYNVHVFCGHTHFFQNIEVTQNLYQHNIGAACGAWWSGDVNRCGCPNGYLIVNVKGNNLMWHYKATGKDVSKQFTLYDRGRFLTQRRYVVANVWDVDSKTKVEWFQDGKPMGEMERFSDVDETYGKRFADRTKACKTAHLFRARPQGSYKEIKVVYTNRFGEQYSEIIHHDMVTIAHRGGAALYPENTIPAMINSLKIGVRNLEMDLQVTQDGKVVVSHDPYLKGFDKQYPIFKNDYADLASHNIGIVTDTQFPKRKNVDCHIPLLGDLIDSTEQYCKSHGIEPVDYTIEIKSTSKRDNVLAPEYKAYTDLCMDVLKEKELGNRLLIQSFDVRTLKYMHKKYPNVRLMYLINDKIKDYDSAIDILGFIPDVISRNYQTIDKIFVDKAHGDGVEVISYTADDKNSISELANMGIDAVITNCPDELMKCLKKKSK